MITLSKRSKLFIITTCYNIFLLLILFIAHSRYFQYLAINFALSIIILQCFTHHKSILECLQLLPKDTSPNIDGTYVNTDNGVEDKKVFINYTCCLNKTVKSCYKVFTQLVYLLLVQITTASVPF